MQKYQACMLLAAVGDAIGYKNGQWEFNRNGPDIHQQMMQLTDQGGVLKLKVNKKNFRYSDDTVMHFATAKGLIQCRIEDSLPTICQKVAKEYKACWKSMSGRGPGLTCRRSIDKIFKDGSNWDAIPFEKNGGGCGASMRAACIGLVYFKDIKKLVQISIETGRITHHNPLGYLGAVVAAYFTALAIKNKPPQSWLHLLFNEALPLARQYVKNSRQGQINLNSGDWQRFQDCWKKYAQTRKMSIKQDSKPIFPQAFGVKERQKYYKSISINGWPGALGVDSVIIAYDALLGAQSSWEELCLRGTLHGGDSDSTGTIASAWFGAVYAFKNVPNQHLEHAQGREQALSYGSQLFRITSQISPIQNDLI